MKILHLTLKKKWFDMIASGEKTEEYREIKPYWVSRLTVCSAPRENSDDNKNYAEDFCFDLANGHTPLELLKSYRAKFKGFHCVEFRNGYGRDAAMISFWCLYVTINQGKAEWGAATGVQYFLIKIGERIKT